MSGQTEFVLTSHARDMLKERNISEDWLWQTLDSPDKIELGTEGNLHYLRAIQAQDNRVLRIIVNNKVTPFRIVTVFFDRRLSNKTR